MHVGDMWRRAASLPQRRGDKLRDEARHLLKAHILASERHNLGRLAARGTWQGQLWALKPIKSVTIQLSETGDWHHTDDAQAWLPHVEKYFADKRGASRSL